MDDILKELKKRISENDTSSWGVVSQMVDGFAKSLLNTVQPFSQVQDAAANLAKSIGIGGRNIMAMAENMVKQNRRMELSMQYNISTADMLNMEAGIMQKLGRNVRIEYTGFGDKNVDSTLENVMAANKLLPDQFADMAASYDALGMSMKTAAKATGKLFSDASKYGINFQKYASNFASNLKMAQQYTFRNGVDGLKEMARRATEIRQDMSQIANFAEKVGTVTGAVETAAQLQVLGGSFASLSNPLAMLNESLTNMEGLQERFNQMTATAATYNQATHQIEMDPWTRQQIKRAAQIMGVDAGNLIDQAYAQARRSEIERQTRGIGNLNTDFAELIKNAGEIDEYGRAGITVDGQFKTLSDIAALSPKQQEDLQKSIIEQNRSESDDVKAIAKDVQTIRDRISGTNFQLENSQAFNAIREGTINGLSTWDAAIDALNKITGKVINAAGNLEHPFTNAANVALNTMAGSVVRTLESFTASTPQALAQGMKEALTEELGELKDTNLGKIITDFTTTATSAIGNWFQSFSDEIKKKTDGAINMLVFTGSSDGSMTGAEGGESPMAQPTMRPFTMGARDVTLQTQNLSFPELTNTTNNGEDSITRLAREIGESIKTTYLELSANNETMPNQVVYEGSYGPANFKYAHQANPETRDFNYNLNLSGTLNMNVTGDNGKITEVNLMEMLEKMGFANEIAKTIKDTLARMEASGQLGNK